MTDSRPITSISASRVPATDIRVGDAVALTGLVYFTVEWIRTGEDGSVFMAGLRSNGSPHVNTLTPDAMASRVFRIDR